MLDRTVSVVWFQEQHCPSVKSFLEDKEALYTYIDISLYYLVTFALILLGYFRLISDPVFVFFNTLIRLMRDYGS